MTQVTEEQYAGSPVKGGSVHEAAFPRARPTCHDAAAGLPTRGGACRDLDEETRVYQLIALYTQPADPAAFDKHYREVHGPLAAKIPGLTRFTATWCTPGPDGSPPPYYLVAMLEADSEAAMQAGMGSAEGAAAVADLPNFAGAGVAITTGSTETFL